MLSLVLIGFIAGFYTHRYATRKKMRHVAEMRFAHGFQEHLFKKIQASPEQREQMLPFVENYAGKIASIHKASRAQRKKLIDSLYEEITPFMREDQVEQLFHFSKRFKDGERKKREDLKDKEEKKEHNR